MMGFKPMMLSQNIVAYEKSKQQACEIQAMMGFKPMMLSQNIVELMKNQSRKPLKFRL